MEIPFLGIGSEREYERLRSFNLAMGLLHAIQGGLMLLLANSFSLPLKTFFYKETGGAPANVIDEVAKLELASFIALFLFISAFFHFLLASPVAYDWYVKNLKNKINYARWYEYSLSSSVMIVIIAMLCGIFDIALLLALFGLNASMNFFGLLMELHNQTTKKTNWTAFIFGCFAGILPWVIIALYFVTAARSVQSFPNFVYGILISLFLFFNIFALNMFLQYKQIGKWKDYLFGEKMYIVLSLVAKSALAWQVFSGTLRG